MPNSIDWDYVRKLVHPNLQDDEDLAKRLAYAGLRKFEETLAPLIAAAPGIPSHLVLRLAHKEIFERVYEKAGEFRESGIRIGSTSIHPAWHNRIIPELERVRRTADAMFKDAKSDAERARAIALFAGQTWLIQPFRDGNTRTSTSIAFALADAVCGGGRPEIDPDRIKDALVTYGTPFGRGKDKHDLAPLAYQLSGIRLPVTLATVSPEVFRIALWPAYIECTLSEHRKMLTVFQSPDLAKEQIASLQWEERQSRQKQSQSIDLQRDGP